MNINKRLSHLVLYQIRLKTQTTKNCVYHYDVGTRKIFTSFLIQKTHYKLIWKTSIILHFVPLMKHENF